MTKLQFLPERAPVIVDCWVFDWSDQSGSPGGKGAVLWGPCKRVPLKNGASLVCRKVCFEEGLKKHARLGPYKIIQCRRFCYRKKMSDSNNMARNTILGTTFITVLCIQTQSFFPNPFESKFVSLEIANMFIFQVNLQIAFTVYLQALVIMPWFIPES